VHGEEAGPERDGVADCPFDRGRDVVQLQIEENVALELTPKADRFGTSANEQLQAHLERAYRRAHLRGTRPCFVERRVVERVDQSRACRLPAVPLARSSRTDHGA
jgi:hypothetical protein